MNGELFKKIDSNKTRTYFDDHANLSKSSISKQALSNRNFITQSIKTGYARIALWNNVCDIIGVPRDYFDYIEPVVESVTEEKSENDLKDILISILVSERKQEALLLSIEDLLKKLM